MSLRFGILGLLDRSPLTGYHLKKLFDRTLSNVWAASLSQIYRELSMLEKERLVFARVQEQDDRPDRKIYAITPSGRQIFGEWLRKDPETYLSPKRDAFMLRMFFGAAMGAVDVRRQMEQFIKDREQAEKTLADTVHKAYSNELRESMFRPSEEEEVYLRFILRRAQMSNQLMIEWAKECIAELDERKKNHV